jgi:hypothetical protein
VSSGTHKRTKHERTFRKLKQSRHPDPFKPIKAAFAALRQLPEDVPNAAKGAEIIKRTLSSLAAN